MTSRELQIAFERKVMLMDPSLRDAEKLTSDTIFAFLNSAQDKLFNELCRKNCTQEGDLIRWNKTLDNSSMEWIMPFLMICKLLDHIENESKYIDVFKLPSDFCYYRQSASFVQDTYLRMPDDQPSATVINRFITLNDMLRIAPTYYDHKIIRHPYAAIDAQKGAIVVLHDEYTVIEDLRLDYFRKPKAISLKQECEFPDIAHQTIVDLAVEIFVTESKYRLNMKQS